MRSREWSCLGLLGELVAVLKRLFVSTGMACLQTLGGMRSPREGCVGCFLFDILHQP